MTLGLRHCLEQLDQTSAAYVLAETADIMLLIDEKGIISDLGITESSAHKFNSFDPYSWVGKNWEDTVTAESRPKLNSLLSSKDDEVSPVWRQVNHFQSDAINSPDLPVSYTTIKPTSDGPTIAIGRELSVIASMQQQLLAAQQSMEKNYARMMSIETRYRLLFQMSAEAVILVDIENGKIIEANPAANRMFASYAAPLTGAKFPIGFNEASAREITNLLQQTRRDGRAEDIAAMLDDGSEPILVSAALLNHDSTDTGNVLIIRLTRASDNTSDQLSKLAPLVLETTPDAVAICDDNGIIVSVNKAFLSLAGLVNADEASGQPLDRWIGRNELEFNILRNNLRQHNNVRLFSTVMRRGDHGSEAAIEVSCARVDKAENFEIYSIRNVENRIGGTDRAHGGPMHRPAEQLKELVGQVELKELVRESATLVEKLCIEAALELTGNNRASAANMLGVSRQSLYTKMRQHNIGSNE